MANSKILFDESTGKVINTMAHEYTVAGGLEFDGVNDYVQVPHSPSLNFENTDDFSCSVIVKPLTLSLSGASSGFLKLDISNAGYNIDFSSSSGNYFIGIGLWQTSFNIRKYVGFSEPFANVVNTTVHYTIVKSTTNASNFKLYKNGVLLTPTFILDLAFSGSMTNTLPVTILAQVPSPKYDNQILNHLAIFNKALTQAEINELFETKGQSIPVSANSSLVANYPFRDGEGFTLTDISGNGNNGTLTNYTLADVTQGVNNSWLDTSGNPYQS